MATSGVSLSDSQNQALADLQRSMEQAQKFSTQVAIMTNNFNSIQEANSGRKDAGRAQRMT
jgi:hypothetical protein